MTVSLNGPFSMDSIVDEFDVRQMKKALNVLGHYIPFEKIGITGIADKDIFDALKNYQMASGLPVTGAAKPDDDTIRALNHDLEKPRTGHYIWRTVDDGKVRAFHARLNRTIRAWNDAPDPGDDYNCRCWAKPISEDLVRQQYDDAIKPTIGPVEFLAGGIVLNSAKLGAALITRTLSAIVRDVEWIKSVPIKQLQKKFKHAKSLGIKGNQNKQNLAAFKKALEEHIKSPDTKVIKGTYHKKPVTHYYNPKTGVNIIKDSNGKFKSVWKLSEDQIDYLQKFGKLGGGKK